MTDNPLAPVLDAIAARLKADAERIAELEAELHIAEVWRVRAEQAEARSAENGKEICRMRTRAEQAEAELAALKDADTTGMVGEMVRLKAELAALKGRRCETCIAGKDNHTYIRTFWCHQHSCQMFPDESCSRWTARAEEGGEK